ncbi:MAG: hypothetical protein ABL958_13275 [Bdellovibrionia bacterium]
MKSIINIFGLSLLMFPNIARAQEKAFVAMIGTEGPQVVAQAFTTALVGYRLSEYFEFDLLYSNGGEIFKEQTKLGTSMSAQVSYFPFAYTSSKTLKLLFIRAGPALQEMEVTKKTTTPEQKWRSKISGVEVSAGIRLYYKWLVFEGVPFTLFSKSKEEVTSGVATEKSEIDFRVIALRAGITF